MSRDMSSSSKSLILKYLLLLLLSADYFTETNQPTVQRSCLLRGAAHKTFNWSQSRTPPGPKTAGCWLQNHTNLKPYNQQHSYNSCNIYQDSWSKPVQLRISEINRTRQTGGGPTGFLNPKHNYTLLSPVPWIGLLFLHRVVLHDVRSANTHSTRQQTVSVGGGGGAAGSK